MPDRIPVYGTLRTRPTDNRTENFVKSQVRILEAKILRWTDQMLHAMLTSQFTFGASVSMNIVRKQNRKDVSKT